MGFLGQDKMVQPQAEYMSIHSFSIYLLNFSYKLGLVLGTGKDLVDKTAFMEFPLQRGNVK